VGAVVPLLGRRELFNDAARAIQAHGARVAGQLADALADPATAEPVRRRLPLILSTCASRRALEGLVEGLSDASLTVRLRCGRALLKMTTAHRDLGVSRDVACAAAEREVDSGSDDERSISHVFDLLALAYDRQAIGLARSALEARNSHCRGTALAYLEATLPRSLFAKLEQRLAGQPSASTQN
jgi:hypothetical protein